MELVEIKKSKIEDVQKFVFRTKKQELLEFSLIRKGDGKDIICTPTQTSCNMGCQFCHLTGLNLPVRNLNFEEISDYVQAVGVTFNQPKNDTLLISYMGAGEPLLNVDNMIKSCRLIQDHLKNDYKNIRFAVSSIFPNEKSIISLTKDVKSFSLPIKLHFSLHSADHVRRKMLMPAAMNAKKAIKYLLDYREITGQPIEIHYTLIGHVNDSDQDIDWIKEIVDRSIPIKILKFSPSKNTLLQETYHTSYFKRRLEEYGLYTVEEYVPPGQDIGVSCGQFFVKN